MIHPTYDPKTMTWFHVAKNGKTYEGRTIRDLVAVIPRWSLVKDYYPGGTPRHLMPQYGLISQNQPQKKQNTVSGQEAKKKSAVQVRANRDTRPDDGPLWEPPYRASMLIKRPLYPPGEDRIANDTSAVKMSLRQPREALT